MLKETPVGLDEIIHTFGSLDTPNFESRYIVPFTLPYPLFYDGHRVLRARCHYLIVDNFMAAFERIESAMLSSQVQNYSGIFNQRPITGNSKHASTHSLGIAIDLEAEKYPLGSTARMPQPIVDIFKSVGFFYGGDFKSRKDPMHFQFAEAY
jgi:hypothetical protein